MLNTIFILKNIGTLYKSRLRSSSQVLYIAVLSNAWYCSNESAERLYRVNMRIHFENLYSQLITYTLLCNASENMKKLSQFWSNFNLLLTVELYVEVYLKTYNYSYVPCALGPVNIVAANKGALALQSYRMATKSPSHILPTLFPFKENTFISFGAKFAKFRSVATAWNGWLFDKLQAPANWQTQPYESGVSLYANPLVGQPQEKLNHLQTSKKLRNSL
jgi:hypothetical protein